MNASEAEEKCLWNSLHHRVREQIAQQASTGHCGCRVESSILDMWSIDILKTLGYTVIKESDEFYMICWHNEDKFLGDKIM